MSLTYDRASVLAVQTDGPHEENEPGLCPLLITVLVVVVVGVHLVVVAIVAVAASIVIPQRLLALVRLETCLVVDGQVDGRSLRCIRGGRRRIRWDGQHLSRKVHRLQLLLGLHQPTTRTCK